MTLRGGRYEILGTIAAGGMATVHLGRALGAGGFERLVAVKTMHPHLAKEGEFVAMFLDEARLAARIRHANVVATLDIQQDDEGLFLVMEYVEGASLSRILKGVSKQGARLPIDVALRIFTDSLAGLHAAHELTGPGGEPLNLIHRDISPHNILVGTDGAARLTDFGVARAESRLATTRTGSLKGKVMYMAPEQVRSEPLDRRADIYAAGVVLWEMLAGERLVQGDSDMAMMHQIVEGERKTPSGVNPDVPEALSEACMKALERAPEDRYPTAAAFAEGLEKAASASNLRTASPRSVGALLRELDPQIENLARRIADGTHRPLLPSSVGEMPGSARVGAPAGPDALGEGGASAATSMEQSPRSTSTRATFSAPVEPAGARRSRKGLVFAGAAVIGLAAGAWLVFGRGTQDTGAAAPSAVASEPPTFASAPAPPTVAPAGTGSTSTSASAGASAAGATPPASASASASGSAAPSVRGAAPRPAGTGGPKSFRPKEL